MSVKIIAILFAIALALGAGYVIYRSIYNAGVEDTTTQINEQNAELNAQVLNVNENIQVRVRTDDATIRVQSQEIEDRINEMPDESISNVTRARLERVRNQQGAVSEASR